MNINHEEINRRIGRAIAQYRQRSGLTQEQVAEKLQIGNEAVSRMERGLIMPNVVRLLELAEIFDCTAAELLAEHPRPAPPVSGSPTDLLNHAADYGAWCGKRDTQVRGWQEWYRSKQ